MGEVLRRAISLLSPAEVLISTFFSTAKALWAIFNMTMVGRIEVCVFLIILKRTL